MLHLRPVDAVVRKNLIAKLHGLATEASTLQCVRLLKPFLQLIVSTVAEFLRLDQTDYLLVHVGLECAVKYVLLLPLLMLLELLLLVWSLQSYLSLEYSYIQFVHKEAASHFQQFSWIEDQKSSSP